MKLNGAILILGYLSLVQCFRIDVEKVIILVNGMELESEELILGY
tara:strand:+ start:2197 stop:2331 length:135 start_codon:yes stop_codon:yes gene_type:complete